MSAAKANISVTHPSGQWRDRGRRYTVKIDGVAQGKIGSGKTLTVPVDAGRHTVSVRLDWTGSPDLEIDCGSGDLIELRAEPGDSLFSRDGYLRLVHVGAGPAA